MRSRAVDGREVLVRTARTLGRAARARNPAALGGGRPPPPLVLFTDPDRLPDPITAAAHLPRGSLVVLRTFGRPEVEALAPALLRLCRRRGHLLLVGADARLAARIGADGVHLPERALAAARALKRRRPLWRVTAAAHSARALVRARAAGVDAVFLSPVFASRSASAAAGSLGVLRASALARAAGPPVYALGGVGGATARRLQLGPFAGLAAVEALRT